jgi:hypothetical protein
MMNKTLQNHQIVCHVGFSNHHHLTIPPIITSPKVQFAFQDNHYLTEYLEHFLLTFYINDLSVQPVCMHNSNFQQSWL